VYLDIGHKKEKRSDQRNNNDQQQTTNTKSSSFSSKISRINPSERVQPQPMETVLKIQTKTNSGDSVEAKQK